MRLYELTVIFPLEEDQYQAGRELLQADLAAAGVEIVKTDEIGDRDLAYEIDRRRRGRYALFTLKVEPAKIAGMDKAFKLNAHLLRYLFVRVEE
ncbi:MAG: 30S ribosomal protein S6 [Treponema sp.]|jgi:small subunit ribosomal protein S6|nr:30S ribosomal protein S6 [Treponema sp.]